MTTSAALETDPMRSFEAERRRQLIEATIETVGEVGFRSASLGEIARRAGVSQGLFAHYFGDKDGLLEATLRFMASRLARATAARIRAAKTPIERVMAVSESALADEEFDRRTSAVWLAFWGQIMHSEPYRRVQSIYQRRVRSNLRHGLRGLVPDDRLDTSVALIAATIDGLWLQSHIEVESPRDGAAARASVRALVDLLLAQCGATDRANAAPAHAAPPPSSASDGAAWRRTPAPERAEVLRAATEKLRRDAKALARFEAKDTGRPICDIEAFDLPLVIRLFERAAEWAAAPSELRIGYGASGSGFRRRLAAETAVIRAGADTALLDASRAAASALAAGAPAWVCAEGRASRATVRLGELLAEAGLPDGAFVALAGDEAARALGAAVAAPRRAAKSALVVAADADLAQAAAASVRGPRRWARRRAFSETLVFVAERVRPAFVERLKPEVAGLALGDPLEPATEVGPLASKEQVERALALVEQARKAGAALWTGGRARDAGGRSRAAFMKPTLLDRCRDEMAVARTESFAPIVAVFGFRDFGEMAERLRRFGPGVSLGAFGRDAGALERLACESGSATCRINDAGGRFLAAREDWLDPWEQSRPPELRIWRDGPDEN